MLINKEENAKEFADCKHVIKFLKDRVERIGMTHRLCFSRRETCFISNRKNIARKAVIQCQSLLNSPAMLI